MSVADFLGIHQRREVGPRSRARGRMSTEQALHPLDVIDFDGAEVEFMTLPQVVRESSLGHIHRGDPVDLPAHLNTTVRTDHYIVMSESNAISNFHTEFSATSVWYHVVTGHRAFYLVPGTPHNTVLFELWRKDNPTEK
jgi:hypothetical protein